MKSLTYFDSYGAQMHQEITSVMKNDTAEMQRFKFFSHKLANGSNKIGYIQSWISDDDKSFIIKHTNATVRFNNKVFMSYACNGGLTLNLEVKGVEFWFGLKFKNLPIDARRAFWDMAGAEWVTDLCNISEYFTDMLDNGLVKRIVKGKITNREELVKAYLKTSPYYRGINIPAVPFMKMLLNRIQGPRDIARYIGVATNPESLMQQLVTTSAYQVMNKFADNTHHNLIEDVITQALVLGEKINFDWSIARMNVVHTEWTLRIMKMEIDSVPEVSYDYKGTLELPEPLTLIDNHKRLFEEGSTMKHCVYTNYKTAVANKTMFIIHGDVTSYPPFTVSVRRNNSGEFYMEQCYGVRNSQVNGNIRDYVKEWVEESNTQTWFAMNYAPQVTQVVAEVDDLPF
jgi:hypothetical protein